MPESQYRYLYERLGDHDFQQLVNAVLASQFPDYTPLALRQADGGRDGVRKLSGQVLVYQTKWSLSGREKDPVSWLDKVIRDEEPALRRLADEGVRRYFMVTNVGSTGKPGSGTFDRLNEKLEVYAKDYGFDEMTCIWREALNPWVDAAPTEIKWAYADMLAGWDLIRYLVAEQIGPAKDTDVRSVIRKVAAAQWEEDKRVKFSQSDVDRERVVDLFVDVTAERVAVGTTMQGFSSVGGAAAYLIRTPTPFTLVRGAPGQGKSTLSQFICQTHRQAFIPEVDQSTSLKDINEPRFPIRADLSDYALWLGGTDVWDLSEESRQRKTPPRKGNVAALEFFLADLVAHESGMPTDPTIINDIFDRVPSLVVLDGLDEVGSAALRAKVVTHIDKFVSRSRAYTTSPKVIVTTRPSAGELPEPSGDLFDVITLNQLTMEQRDAYLRKWCLVRGIRGKEGRSLRRSFKEKSREPYIHELAGNPMQLTILLDLLNQQGAATPTQRTDLYDKYVDLLLAREANKNPRVVREHKDELLEIIPFLGWYLHAHTEESQINGRMSVDELKEAMRHFQRTYGNRESIIDQLFEGASDRLWALTSKLDGTYEFEVLSLREYFAARFLFRNAGEGDGAFDSTDVLRELLKRPYWLNTARFYGGNAKGNGIYALTAGIEQELARGETPASFLAAWALLTDGVFQRRPREARKVLEALCSDSGIAVLIAALDRHEIVPLPGMPSLPDEDGPDPTWARLTGHITENPADPHNTLRVRALRELLGQHAEFVEWWYEGLPATIGTAREDAWLAIGAGCEAGAGSPALQTSVRERTAEVLLNTGLVPAAGGELERQLLLFVLDGMCPNVTSIRSLPAQVAVALAPGQFLTRSPSGFSSGDEWARRRRAEAVGQLKRSGSPFERIAKLRVFKVGQKGSTYPWDDTAAALFAQTGRSWLAYEIAIIAAASPYPLAYTKRPNATAFGATSHPSELLAQVRGNSRKVDWWNSQFMILSDDLDRAIWTLALMCAASEAVVTALFPQLQSTLRQLPDDRRRVVLRAGRQLSDFGWPESRAIKIDVRADEIALVAASESAGSPIAPSLTGIPDLIGLPSLLSVARASKWLKVDSTASYR